MPESPPPPEPSPPPPALAAALTHFERGDFRAATAEAQRLVAASDPEVKAAAEALLARMAPDRWALRLGLLALALLALVTGLYVR